LVNLLLYCAFDRWLQEHHPSMPLERYTDDVIRDCRSEAQANSLRRALDCVACSTPAPS
jgi:RNA-directed DNA polymerase